MNQVRDQDSKQKKTIYYDGSCPMCTVIIGKVSDSAQNTKFISKDTTREMLPQNLTKTEVEKGIHLIARDGKVYKNAEAILKILEEYPRWKFLAKIGKLPIIKQLLTIGYVLVANNRHLVFGSASRIFWLKIVVVCGLIFGLLLSAKLWAGERFFPHVPALSFFSDLSPLVEVTMFLLLVCLLIVTVFYPKPQKLIFTSLVILVIFALFDQMRWQPWLYQYFFMLIILGLFSWDYKDIKGQLSALNLSRLVVASIYFFSGLQKVNFVFITSIFPWMIEPLTNFLPPSLQTIPILFGVFVPFLEMGIGVGLLTNKYRKYAVFLAILMFCFVVFTLGPLGHNWNSIVWPWNVAMVSFAIILFWRVKGFSFRDIMWTENSLFQKILLILFVVMPSFSFFNLWDSYLSSTLYSGNTNSAEIYIDNSIKQKLPAEISKYVTKIGVSRSTLNFFSWSFDELNVPPYPETRVYKYIAKDLCKYADNSNDVVLIVNGKPTLFNGGNELKFDCSNL